MRVSQSNQSRLKVYLAARKRELFKMGNDRLTVIMEKKLDKDQDWRMQCIGMEFKILRTIQDVSKIGDEELLSLIK